MSDSPHYFTDKAVDMGEWTKTLIYCIHCGLTPEEARAWDDVSDQRVREFAERLKASCRQRLESAHSRGIHGLPDELKMPLLSEYDIDQTLADYLSHKEAGAGK